MIRGVVAIVILAGVAFSVSAAPVLDAALLLGGVSSQVIAGLSGLSGLCGVALMSRGAR